jgi:hypothetical protein
MKKKVMAKKTMTFCAMLLATSLAYVANVNAAGSDVLKGKMPIEFIIDARDLDNPRANFLNTKSDLKPGFKWVMLPQVAAMFDPNNPNEPVVLLDVKRTILKIVLKNPELAKQYGISPEDYINAGISEEELQKLSQEAISPVELGVLAQVFSDLMNGDASKGFHYAQAGGEEILKGSAKLGLGFAILIKKATVVAWKFMYENVLPRPVKPEDNAKATK